jgi:hypothetical protein
MYQRRLTIGTYALLMLAATLLACQEMPMDRPMGRSSSVSMDASAQVSADTGPVDTDGDGLDDLREMQLGTDPGLVDTDADGYTDFDEVQAGSDPTDANDRIYKGGWPYNRNKDQIVATDWETPAGLDVRLPRYKAVDQYGDLVDLYDLIGQGRPVVLDVGTWFCDPCKDLASYLSVGQCTEDVVCENADDCLGTLQCTDGKCDASTCVKMHGWWHQDFERVYDMIQNDEIFWVTVLFSKGSPVTHEEAELWHDTWPNSKILVLADTDLQLQEFMNVNAMPRIDVLDENLIFKSFNLSGPSRGMRYLVTNY